MIRVGSKVKITDNSMYGHNNFRVGSIVVVTYVFHGKEIAAFGEVMDSDVPREQTLTKEQYVLVRAEGYKLYPVEVSL